jgi:hypothetical protein
VHPTKFFIVLYIYLEDTMIARYQNHLDDRNSFDVDVGCEDGDALMMHVLGHPYLVVLLLVILRLIYH